MSQTVAVLAAGADWEGEVVQALEGSPAHVLVRRCLDLADLEALVAVGLASSAVLSLDAPGVDRWSVQSLLGQGIAVCLVGRSSPAPWIGETQAVFARAEQAAQVLHVLDEAAGSVAEVTPESAVSPDEAVRLNEPGQIVAVWSGPGAPGRSLVAAGLAHAWHREGRSVMLLDGDLAAASQPLAFGLGEVPSGILALARAWHQGPITSFDVAQAAVAAPGSVRLLTGLPRAERLPELPRDLAGDLCQRLRGLNEITVVDLGPSRPTGGLGFTEDLLLAEADVVVVLGTGDPVGLTRLLRALHDVKERAPGARLQAVVNRVTRASSKTEIATAIIRLYGSVELTWLPADPTHCERAMALGRPITAKGGPLSQQLQALAKRLLAETPKSQALSSR